MNTAPQESFPAPHKALPHQPEQLEGIAIIGMSGRFPGAPDLTTFWRNLVHGKDSLTRFPTDPSRPEYVGARGVLEDAALFDADFFAINPREAERMDPQHRLFLEACSNALESAGYDSHAYPGEIGLFGGCSLNTYLMANVLQDRAAVEELTDNYQVGEFSTFLGNDKDFLTTRVAYKLNLRGPVVSVASACATSLVAIAQASQALLNYTCDMALAGGVSVTFPQERGHVFQKGGLASGDGTCRPFDAQASGTVFGHGVGAVLLKRLEDAVRDGDPIAAVIRGFAVNNDGAQKAGYMAPGIDGQSRVIAAAHAMAGIDPATITYLEAHGTATPLGDPIEVAAATKTFREATGRKQFCSLGTAKGNVGHLDAAAGVTGVIKTVLSMQHRTIPALAHFTAPNPNIDFAETPFFITRETSPWLSDAPLRAGVSAFGVGGVNAHLVLEEAPAPTPRAHAQSPQPICLSARTPAVLKTVATNLSAFLIANPETPLADVAFTLATGRRAFDHRFAFAASTPAEAITALTKAKLDQPKQATRLSVAFVCSGQGSQFVGMGRELYANEPIYRQVVDACCELAQPILNLDLRTLLLAEPTEALTSQLDHTRLAQPALFITELAIARLWQSWGIPPAAVVGHSLGEYTAATLANVFTWQQAIQLVCLRGTLMQSMQPGAMTSIPLDEAAATRYLTEDLSLGALNSPRSTVLSGTFAAIEALESRLTADGVAFRRIRTSHAFHSAMMQPMVDEFARTVASHTLNPPELPFVSTVTGTWITEDQATSPRYWAEQVLKPVRFAEAVATLIQKGSAILLEVGPGEAMTALALHQRNPGFNAIPSLPRTSSYPIQQALAALWMEGVTPDWTAVFAQSEPRRVPLPTYPFERKLHWIEPPARTAPIHTNPQNESTPMPPAAPAPVAPAAPRLDRLRSAIASLLTDLSGMQITSAEYGHQFLELGFDSLFLTQATQSLNKAFGVKLTFRQVMEQLSTIDDLAQHLDITLPAEAFPSPAAPVAIAAAPAFTPTAAPQGIERLLADQLAAMSEMFANQVATLRATAGLAPMQVAAAPVAAPAQRPAAAPIPASNSDVKHGSFRPIQAKATTELTEPQKRYIADLIARYQAKTPTSKSLTQSSRNQLADPRAVAGFRPQWKEMVYPLITDRARGSRIWDVDGNEYIDIVNGYGCIMFGHSPDFVVEAAHAQLDRGVAIGPQSALAGEVAALIAELTGNERVTFCNTGSEAVMAAIRVARTITGKDKLVYFTGDYHGTFDEVLIRNTPRGSAPVAPGIPLANTTNVVVLDYGTDASLDYIRANAADIACVLVEPVQTRHPDNQPLDFIRAIRTITAESDIAFILDEVVTGFRLAPGGVQQMLGIRADMCTYGKVIGGGHPIGVLSGKAMYLDALDGGKWQYGDDSGPEVGVTFFAGTFVRHPLAMAAARAVLTHLKEQGPELQRTLNEKTAKLSNSLDAFFVERGVPARIHHFASWFYWTFPTDARLGSLFYYAMRARGIHIQEGYPCFLTTAHTQQDLDTIEHAFRETILEMQAAGALPTITADPAPEPPSGERSASLHPFALPESPSRIPMTEPQREVFLAAALSDEANCAFNESLTLRLNGPVRLADLGFALDAVITRHDALRSTVCTDGEALCFDPVFRGQTEFLDLSEELAEVRQARIADRIALEARTPFDLHNGPLLRAVCFTVSLTEAVLVINAHHIVLDGWSANQLLEEVGKIYSRGAAALTSLTPLLPFSSYAIRENTRQQNAEFAGNEHFWIEKYQGRNPRLDLPTDRPRPLQKTYAGATLEGSLGATLYSDLKKLSAKNGCTLYVTLLSAFQILMHRLTRQDEVVVGISTAGQSLLEDASLVGHCVNFLPMLSEITDDQTIAQHLRATRTALLDAFDHQEFTYGSLLRKLKFERDPGRLPLIEVQFNLEKVGANVHFDGLTSAIKPNAKRFVNTDLFLNVVESPDNLDYTCDFNTDLFDHETLDRWMKIWAHQLASEAADASTPVKGIDILPAAERTQLLTLWNDTAVDFGPFVSTPAAILGQAAAYPTRTAIVCGARSWSYADLAEYATLLARRLIREGLTPGGIVGICMERSLEMVGSLVAVMMAGGAYVPLDPKHPRERLAQVIEDSGLSILLTGRDSSVDTTARILRATGPQPAGTEALPSLPAPADLAYVIYTSGSTGKPKGVAIEHLALINLLRSMQREPGLGPDDTLVAVTTLAFDIAALELLLPLITGAKLIVATDDQVQDGAQLLRLLQVHQATTLQATPGLWRILIDAGWTVTSTPKPLRVLCGGEALPRDLAERLLDRSGDVWNVYGPTETTIWSSATLVTRSSGPLHIGPPIANTTFFVLDDMPGDLQQPTPIGVTGELYIGGHGLARGYWNRPELTAEKFLLNPFGPATDPGRLYRTGDLARFHADGSVELLGRADFQVKLRGYRIELGDIEAALRQHPAIRESVVIQQKASDAASRLVGFVEPSEAALTSGSNADILVSELREQLARTLPDYMIPAALIVLPAIPRTPNGKIDRKSLPQLNGTDHSTAEKIYTAPETQEETTLAAIWSEVLDLPRVSVTESIFEIGADSLLIFRIAARAQREGISINATQIFQHRTIRALCQAAQQKDETAPTRTGSRIVAASRDIYRRNRVKLDA